MSATKRLSEVSGFKPGWELKVDGQPVQGEWEANSRFGSVRTAVVMGADGKPVFDRPEYREAPNVNCVVWGRGANGEARFALIRQPRPHADNPENHDSTQPVVFGQIVMGFIEKLIGKDLINQYESAASAATREVAEESGARVVLNIERPLYPWHNPNPTFVATWSELVFVEIDPKAIEVIKHDRNEPIFSAEYITADELRKRIANGKDEAGAVYRMCTANSAWFIFFCIHPELFK